MKIPRLRFLSLVCVALSACGVVSHAADGTDASGTGDSSANSSDGKSDSKKKPKTIMLIDGSVLFGKVELTDDYTIKVSSDTGIQKIALAMLGESDFKKYGFSKDRSKDGRFWSERQDAVSGEQKKEDTKSDKSKDDNGQLEISLAEILPFQPLIANYQKDNPKKDDKSSGGDQKDKTASSAPAELPFVPLFSQPGMSSLPTSPLGGLGTGAGLPSAPGSGLLPTAPTALPGLPTAP